MIYGSHYGIRATGHGKRRRGKKGTHFLPRARFLTRLELDPSAIQRFTEPSDKKFVRRCEKCVQTIA